MVLTSSGCASQEIPNHPVRGMTDRVRSRINRLDLVFSDEVRAATVKTLYFELEDLVLEYEARRLGFVQELSALQTDAPDFEAKVAKVFAKAKNESEALMKRYIEVQLLLRKHVTPEEFAVIDALR